MCPSYNSTGDLLLMSRQVLHYRSLQSILISLVLLCFIVPAVAQDGDNPTQRPRKVFPNEPEKVDVLRIDTDLVSVDVTALDSTGRLVRNLRQDDFKVYSDGVLQPLSFFHVERREGEPRPLAIVFALDVSGSMTSDEIERLRLALKVFSAQLSQHPAVYSVMTFGMKVKTLQKFTSEPEKLDEALERIARDSQNGLSTHTYDAVDDAIRLLVRQAPRTHERRLLKRVVLVVTDGFPVGDTVSAPTVIDRANAADVSVYVVTLPSYSRAIVATTQSPLPTPLDVSGLAESTGGKSVYANEKDYAPLFKSLAEEVGSAYVLAFYPPEEMRRDGKVHTIRVEGPNGLILHQSRTEYRGTERQ